MPKIGPPLPPQVPRSRPQAPADPKAPAAAPASTEAQGALAAPPQAADPAQVQAQQVLRQFGTAFTSAGKLASQLVKGLFTGEPSLEAEKEQAEPRQDGGTHAPSSTASGPGLLGTALAALRRARQKRASRSRRKKTRSTRSVDSDHLFEVDEEDVLSRSSSRALLRGDDSEQSAYEQARKEALLLAEMERQGEAPSRILSQLNRQLSARGSQFKRMLSDEVKPQLELLADRVGQSSTEERRQLAALASRAAHQAGSRSSTSFDKLLASTAAAEAQHLASSTGTVEARALELAQALRRASSLAYRAALIDQSQGHLEELARELTGLTAEAMPGALTSLLRAAETLGSRGTLALAQPFVSGVLSSQRPETLEALAAALGLALRAVPSGGTWVVQVLVALVARGQEPTAQPLAEALHGVLLEARGRCSPGFQGLRALKGKTGLHEQEAVLWRRLDDDAALVAGLMPACAALVEQRAQLPAEATALAQEALLALGTLDMVGATAPGQRLLRQALLEQEQGEPIFLSAVPRVALSLSQPRTIKALSEQGLSPATYQFGGSVFIQRVAVQVGRALSGTVIARSQKGDTATAKTLLRLAIFRNAALFGLSPEGGSLAAELLESLRARPNPVHAQRLFLRLEEVGRQHPTANRSGTVESLRGLVTALANRDPQAAPRRARALRTEDSEGRTALEIAAAQSSLSKEQAAKHHESSAQIPAAAPRRGSPPPR